MKTITSHFLAPNVILVKACSTSKMSKNGGQTSGSTVVVECHVPERDLVGLSRITRFNVEERLPRRFCLAICKVPVMSSQKGHK